MANEDTSPPQQPATEPEARVRRFDRILRFVESHPAVGAVGLLGSLASLVSIPLAIYLYVQSQRYPELTYYAHPARAVVTSTGPASSLQVLHKGEALEQDVTAVQLAFWNRGTRSIRREHLLAPIVFTTDPVTPILEADIRKTSRDVIGLELDRQPFADGRLGVSWDILEPGDGAVIQVVYAGGMDVDFAILGAVEGQQEIGPVQGRARLETPSERYGFLWSFWYVQIIMFATLGGSLVFVLVRTIRHPDRGRFHRLFWAALATSGICVLFLLVMLFKTKPIEPPFGF